MTKYCACICIEFSCRHTLRDTPPSNRGTKGADEGGRGKNEERRRETKGGGEGIRPSLENPPIIKLSFIFRRGLKMKLVQDKPAESFRRFYLFSLRLSALLGVSLLRSLLSLSDILFLQSVSIFSIHSPALPSLSLPFSLCYFSFSCEI